MRAAAAGHATLDFTLEIDGMHGSRVEDGCIGRVNHIDSSRVTSGSHCT